MANRAFIRFRDITIPNYAEVSNVYARLTAYSDKTDTPVNLRCAFVNEDNPDAPTSYAELQAFSLTNWVSWDSLDGWTDGQEHDTPDLTNILQGIIEREGWEQDNSVILIIEDVSSDGQRGFSSIQFSQGDERPVLFASYIARETLFIVDDDFTGVDGSYPSNSRWMTSTYEAKPYIFDNQLYVGIFNQYNENVYCHSNWYVSGAIDVSIDFTLNLTPLVNVYKVPFYLNISTPRYSGQLLPIGFGYSSNVARFQIAYNHGGDQNWYIEAVLGKYGDNSYYVRQVVLQGGGVFSLSGNLRISVDNNGYSRFYLNNILWASSPYAYSLWEQDEYSDWRSSEVYVSLGGTTSFYSYMTGTIYLDNFRLNSGVVTGPLGYSY